MDAPHDPVRAAARSADGHVIFNLAHALIMEKTGDENVGIGPIELFVPKVLTRRGNPKPPALAVIKDCGKDTGGIKSWKAKPINRSVYAHQRRGAHVADYPVILDRQIGRFHCDFPPKRTTQCRPES